MRRALLSTIACLAIALAGLTALGAPAQAADRDCGDFATQAAAQEFYLSQGGPGQDPHGLDGEGDGIVCESNPCPCSTSQGGGGGAQPGTKPKPAAKVYRNAARVIRVVDGDTVDVRLVGGARKRVRMIGIDTPEVYGGAECGGRAASASLKRILPPRTRVMLTSDPTQDLKDRYGRVLRYVGKNGSDVNRAQVARGHASVYVYNGNPFQRVSKYRAAQRTANQQDRGLWGGCR